MLRWIVANAPDGVVPEVRQVSLSVDRDTTDGERRYRPCTVAALPILCVLLFALGCHPLDPFNLLLLLLLRARLVPKRAAFAFC